MKESPQALSMFHPAVRRWFGESFNAPTPPQAQGWPPISRGENTLILAPTGSGKTLAAFLFAINDLIERQAGGKSVPGVEILYLSPLKALAADVERNLAIPLSGIRAAAGGLGIALPEVNVGVRTGDTSAADRQKMVRHPPHILITTPESLNLILTSPRAREMLRSVRYVIVDEIHAVCTSKRGSFLSLLLERLEELSHGPITRIGLSATQKPLDAVARFLGGYDGAGVARPVTIVDTGMRKGMDVSVQSPVADMRDLPRDGDGGPSIWPAIYDRLLDLVAAHRSTLIFANNRRSVERIASEMNKRAGYRLVSAHHGSVSKEQRQEIEQDLKAGRLPALVATGSLELGIDMGNIDLVCQVESPHSVARALQRVGRAGHVYHAVSKGVLLPKTREDLAETAALVRAMRAGKISAVRIPRYPLDVLAQQIAAMVAVAERDVDGLYHVIRRATPYHALSRDLFVSVIEMLSGAYTNEAVRNTRPRISWDRLNNKLYPLPGTRHVAIVNGGAIPDTGQFAVVLEDGKTRLGELDEEFIYERRTGETILLGTGRWRIVDIGSDRVVVAPSQERTGQMPFWRGEGLGRDVEFGRRYGAFLRECECRLDEPGFVHWLEDECSLDEAAAQNLSGYLEDQRRRGDVIPNDRVILLDAFKDDLGEARLAILSPFGRAFHHALLLALSALLRRNGEPLPASVHSDSGIILKLGDLSVDRAVSLLQSLADTEVESLILEEVERSPLFGMSFRQNAARALLLPRLRPGRRTPLWLQRLRARDLLALARAFPSFPIVVETYREVMEDRLPIHELGEFLREVRSGQARFALRRGQTPSPFAASLTFDFVARYMYEWDEPKLLPAGSNVDRATVEGLVGARARADLFSPEVVRQTEEQLQGISERARDGTELVELMRRIGDLTRQEIAERCEPEALAALPDLLQDGRIVEVNVAGADTPLRMAVADDAARYENRTVQDLEYMIARYLAAHAVVDRDELRARYAIEPGMFSQVLASIDPITVVDADSSTRICDRLVASTLRRRTIARSRRRREAVSAPTFASFLAAHQHLGGRQGDHQGGLVGVDGLREVLSQLSWCYLPVNVWPRVLGERVSDYRAALLEQLLRTGEFTWRGIGRAEGGRRIAFSPRDCERAFLEYSPPHIETQDPVSNDIAAYLSQHGARFLHEIAAALGIVPSQAADALWKLLWTGRLTNDSLDPVWAGKPRAELWRSRHRGSNGWTAAGRWSTFSATPEADSSATRFEPAAKRLLARYGILAREMISMEQTTTTWANLYPLLNRWEWQGSLERGLFVDHVSGVQFAERGSMERLAQHTPAIEMMLINACDPANAYGAAGLFSLTSSAGEPFPLARRAGNYLILRGGVPVMAIENRGERITSLAELSERDRRAAVSLLPRLVERESKQRSIRIREWDDGPASESAAREDLEAIGFVCEDLHMIYYRGFDAGGGA